MNIHTFTPFIRYGLIALASWLARGGWLPEDVARDFATDPAVVELVTGLCVGIGTLAWYLYSRSRKALKEAMK